MIETTPYDDNEPATPSRRRTTPSGAVGWVWEYLKQKDEHARLKRAVDIGCGRGRNSLFLARKGLFVTAMDFSPNALAALQKAAAKQKLDGKIRAILQDVTEGWAVESHETDLAVDAFCFRHLPTKTACQTYKENLLRILSVWGHYLISFSSIGDGYYGHYVHPRKRPVMPVDKAVCIDPGDVEAPLYNRRELIDFMKPELEVEVELKNEARDCPGAPETYALLFRRSPHWFYT